MRTRLAWLTVRRRRIVIALRRLHHRFGIAELPIPVMADDPTGAVVGARNVST